MRRSRQVLQQKTKQMLLLTEAEVKRCLQIDTCIDINRKALGSLRSPGNAKSNNSKDGDVGVANVPTRIALPYYSKRGIGSQQQQQIATQAPPQWTLFKPASYESSSLNEDDDNNTLMGMKIVSMRPDNASKNLPTVPASILLVDAETGQLSAILGATYLTAARTAAGSAIATQNCFSRNKHIIPSHLVVFGAGLQAELHIECLLHLFPSSITHVSIVNRTQTRANLLAEKLLRVNHLSTVDIVPLAEEDQVRNAVQTADIIVMATNSYQPLFQGQWLKPGCHINGVGSYTPQMCEVDQTLVNRSKIIIDTEEARNVGDLQHVNPNHILGLLGDVLANDVNWEEYSDALDCTFFKSVGTAIQDIFTADIVVKKARELGIGTDFHI